MTIEISEDLNRRANDPDRFCAVLVESDDLDLGGFGATEEAALRDLAGQAGLSAEQLAAATYERFATR